MVKLKKNPIIVECNTPQAIIRQIISAKASKSDLDLFNLSYSTVDTVTSILSLIEQEKQLCTPGTTLELPGMVDQYGIKKFSAESRTAWNRANLLTRLWKYSPGLFSVTDPVLKNQTESLLYAAIREMVESSENIHSAGNCYDWYQYAGHDTFCPFAMRMPNSSDIVTKDLAQTYEYRASSESQWEWFYAPTQRPYKPYRKVRAPATRQGKVYVLKLSETDGYLTARAVSFGFAQTRSNTEDVLLVGYEDGHWSQPYFDCGGGNIWMTYTVPFFGFNWTTQEYRFIGTSGIDVDLRRMDIDQCPLKPESAGLNVFAGSAKCKPTTECEPISGSGLTRGSYKCVCSHGYYFPHKAADIDANNYSFFHGTVIEEEYEKFHQNLNNSYATDFACLPCHEGCTAGCKDDSAHCGV